MSPAAPLKDESGFGRWLKARREALRRTQAELAGAVGISLATIRNWERAEVLPRVSGGIKTALARELRLSLADLERIGRGELKDVPIEPRPEPERVCEAQLAIRIENYRRAKGLLKGVAANALTIRDGGYLPHKYTIEKREFAWIIEDESMAALDGYQPGDVVVFAEMHDVPAGSDVIVQIHSRNLGVVRRIYYEADRAILVALNRKFEPHTVSLKDVSHMAMAVCIAMRSL